MKFEQTKLPGVVVISPDIFKDNRGYFLERYNKKAYDEIGITNVFVQTNHSFSTFGTIRGFHFQSGEHAQAKLISVIQGKILDVVVDVNPKSKTYRQYTAIELDDETKKQIFIPRGYAHGFSVLSKDATITYQCDNYYHKANEGGVRYNDPSLNIDWKIPLDQVSVSEKDLRLPLLGDPK